MSRQAPTGLHAPHQTTAGHVASDATRQQSNIATSSKSRHPQPSPSARPTHNPPTPPIAPSVLPQPLSHPTDHSSPILPQRGTIFPFRFIWICPDCSTRWHPIARLPQTICFDCCMRSHPIAWLPRSVAIRPHPTLVGRMPFMFPASLHLDCGWCSCNATLTNRQVEGRQYS